MKKELILVMCLLITCFVAINAQTINGVVTDKSNSPIEYATVVLLTTDSLYISGTTTDSTGHFSLDVNLPEYRLVVQHLIYETYTNNYSNEYEIAIELTEKENTLDEVIIKGEKPVVKLVDGRITYDMPLLLSGTTVSNAYESILRLPGVREQNGSLALVGANSVTVIINGKVTTMPHENLMAALKMYPAEMVQSAEIMYSAPPQYHIRGAAINLILKSENNENSLQGQVNGLYTQKYYANYTSGISLLIPSSKLTTDLNYAYNRIHDKTGVDIFSDHLYNGTTNRIEQFNRGGRKSDVHHIRLGMDYKVTDKDRLNLTYTSQITSKVDNAESSVGTFSESSTNKSDISPVQIHNVLIDYSTGFGLKVGGEYTFYNTNTEQHFLEKMTGKQEEFTTQAKQKINRYRLFVDQSHSLPSEWKLNYGAQYMHATDKSSQVYSSISKSDISNLDMNNNLEEYTASAYIGIEKNIGNNLSLSASLTGEYYKLVDFNEWTIFPVLEITYFLSPSQIMQLSFSSDKTYPAYWEMLGAISYLNGYSEIHGNPLLRPYRTYSGQLNYILNSKYILTAFYSYLDAYSMQLPYQAQDRLALIYKTLNFDYMQTAGLNLIIPFDLGQTVKSRLTLMGFYDKVKSSHFHDTSFSNDNVVFYSKLDNTITISSKPNISMEINGSYISKNIQGPADLTSLWNLDAGLKWTFFHEMAELRLKGTDLFNSWTPDMSLKYDTQNLRMNMIPDGRAASISFVFKFGGYDRKHKELDSSRFGTN